MGAFRVIAKSARDLFDDMLPMVLMNMLSLLCHLTIVLGPPSAAAMHAMCHRSALGLAFNWSTYWQAFRQYFGKSWLLFLPSAVALFLIGFNFAWYGLTFPEAGWSQWVQGAWLAVFALWSAVGFYIMPFLIMQEEKRVRTAIRNAALVAVSNPVYTLILLLFGVLLTVVNLVIIPLVFFFGLVVWAMLANQAVVDRVDAFRKREEVRAAKSGKNVSVSE
jgi:uncharacterized membrane protein YesL